MRQTRILQGNRKEGYTMCQTCLVVSDPTHPENEGQVILVQIWEENLRNVERQNATTVSR